MTTAKKWKPKERWRPLHKDNCYEVWYSNTDGRFLVSDLIFYSNLAQHNKADEEMRIVKTKREATAKCKELNRAIKSILKG